MKKIKLTALKNHVVDELLIYSLSQTLYSIRVIIDGDEYIVENKGKPYRAFSIGQVRKDTAMIQVGAVTLKHNSAYDEMIGQSTRTSENTLTLTTKPPVVIIDDETPLH